MGVETINDEGVEGLNPEWPLDTDEVVQGVNHFRLIKKAVKNEANKVSVNSAPPQPSDGKDGDIWWVTE